MSRIFLQTILQKTEPVKIQPKPDPHQVQQIHVVTTPLNLQPRIGTSGLRPSMAGSPRGADGRPLLPRPSIRGMTPTSVLSIGGAVRSPIRAGTPRQVTPVQTRVVQKRVSTGSLPNVHAASISPGLTQIKKTIISSPKMVQRSVVSSAPGKVGQKAPIGRQQQQSFLSPQQKMLMARRKLEEEAGINKTPNRGLAHGARGAGQVNRGRGRVVGSMIQANKPKESKLVESVKSDDILMKFQQIGSDSSDDETHAVADPNVPAAPESPPRPFTLCPLTGRIIGPDGEPMEQVEQSPSATRMVAEVVTTSGGMLQQTPAAATITMTSSSSGATTELVLPNLDALTDGGGLMRVEMSPGGTTGTIGQY